MKVNLFELPGKRVVIEATLQGNITSDQIIDKITKNMEIDDAMDLLVRSKLKGRCIESKVQLINSRKLRTMKVVGKLDNDKDITPNKTINFTLGDEKSEPEEKDALGELD